MYIDKSLTLPEIFDRVAKKETVSERAELLMKYDTKTMRWFVDSLYNRDFSALEVPKYTKSDKPVGMDFMNLKQAIPRIETALKNHEKAHVVDRNLTLVLENISADEAELVEKVIKGEKRIKGVSKSVFKKAYPEFFHAEQASE